MVSSAARSLACFCLAATCGCAALRPIEPGQPIELRENEGILLVDIASNVHLDRLSLTATTFVSGLTFVEDVPAGHSQWLFAAPAGDYRWAEIHWVKGFGYRTHMNLIDYWKFRVEPGRISYPGMLVVHGSLATYMTGNSSLSSLNRSALSYMALEASFPGIAERYPMVYTGHTRDEFLIRYQAERSALRTAEPGDETRSGASGNGEPPEEEAVLERDP